MKVIVPTKFNYQEGSYSRNTIATYYDDQGILSIADINTLRINYNPETLVCLGTLLELEATNYCLFSENYVNSTWNKSGITLGSSVFGLDNLASGTKIVESGSSTHIVSQIVNHSFSGIYYFSVHVKAAERTKLRIEVSNHAVATVDLIQKTITAIGNVVSSNITTLKNDWYRISIGVDLSTSTVDYRIVLLNDSGQSAYTASSGYGLYIFGSQIEYNILSSYIKTSSTPGYRAADEFSGSVTGIYYSNVLEDEHPLWSNLVSYVVDAMVIREHRIYKCLQNNTGLDPLISSSWEYVKPTNRWAAFDLYAKRSTTKTGS